MIKWGGTILRVFEVEWISELNGIGLNNTVVVELKRSWQDEAKSAKRF